MTDYNKIAGSNLKRLRKQTEFTQEQLAYFTDKTLRTIQRYESGEISMSVSVLSNLAYILDVDINEFFEHIEYEESNMTINIFVITEE